MIHTVKCTNPGAASFQGGNHHSCLTWMFCLKMLLQVFPSAVNKSLCASFLAQLIKRSIMYQFSWKTFVVGGTHTVKCGKSETLNSKMLWFFVLFQTEWNYRVELAHAWKLAGGMLLTPQKRLDYSFHTNLVHGSWKAWSVWEHVCSFHTFCPSMQTNFGIRSQIAGGGVS